MDAIAEAKASETTTLGGRRALITLALCLLVAGFEGVDLQAAGVVMPHIGPLFHFLVSEKKWFFAASTIGLVVGATIGGRLADRWGRKAALMIAIAVFGVFSIATALALNPTQLIEARLLTGVGLGGALPNLIALTAEASRTSHRRGAVALMYCGMPLGGGCASLLSLLGATGSWQDVFYVGGAAPLALLPLLWLFLPDSAEFQASQKTQQDKALLSALFQENRAARTLLLWISFFSALLVLYMLLNWLPSLMVKRGLSGHDASLIQVAFNLVGVAGIVIAGVMLERAPLAGVVVFFAGVTLSLALLAVTPATMVATLVAVSLLGAAVMGAQSILYALAPEIYPTSVRGTGVGAAVSAGRLGSVAGPLLAGLIVEAGGSTESVLFYMVPIAAFSLITTLVLIKRR